MPVNLANSNRYGFWLLGRKENKVEPPRKHELPIVLLETIGREHSGKTALKVCYYKGPLAGPQPSGLELAAADPRVMTKWMVDALETYSDLTDRGLISTIDPEVMPFQLYYADEPRAILQHREVIGQVLTHTTPDSDAQQQELFQQYVGHLTRAHVLQVVIACPASDAPADLDRFEADLMVTASYLREALKVRAAGAPPVALQLLLAKLDVPFASATDAGEALPDERMRAMLDRLVRIVEGSSKVGLGAIFPVSAFGFGTAQPEGSPVPTITKRPAGGFSVVSQGETEWFLKPGTSPAPFNLTAATWWAIMAGLLLKPADAQGEELARTARLMADDLKAMGAWFVKLNPRGQG